jgi:CheY-like chemotaxis protein
MQDTMTEQPKEEQIQRKVLVVDDDPLIIRMYERKLRNDGYDVRLAHSGQEVLTALQRDLPDIILLDIMMPIMNGVETLHILKNDARTRDIPVIMLTNLGDRPEDMDKAKELGAIDYLVKADTDLRFLSARIEKALTEKK